MKVLFLDESGDHNLDVIDPSCPLFVPGGVIVAQHHAQGLLEEALRAGGAPQTAPYVWRNR